jgi:hypothetical protein
MKRTWPVMLAALSASAVMLAGCASSTRAPQRAGATASVGSLSLSAGTPLTTCVNPTPAEPKPIDTTIARDFAADRIERVLSLDDGAFRADPAPRNVVPKISAALAFCNLLAGATVENVSVIEAAAQHGMSFGLGVVTVADSVLKTTPQSYLVGGRQQTTSLQPYHRRLAWIAVIKPDIVAACPSNAPTARSAQKALPGYQILAIDADTGAAGIIYAAKTNALCNYPGYQPASVAPAVEFVSVAWTLVKRGPGTHSASITYQPRPCDSRDLGYFADTKQPAVFADRDNPARVNIVLERTLVTCGPATTVPLLLRSSDLKTALPQHLIHAPLGADDVPPTS